MQVSDAVYALFEQDRVQARTAVRIKPDVTDLSLRSQDFYDGPDGSPRGQRFQDYRIVYRSRVSPDTVKDPQYAHTTLLWPEPKNWRVACAARRRWEI